MNADPSREVLSQDAVNVGDAAKLLRVANAILVVAHPDDEILWFSSVVSKVSKVLVVFSDDPSVPDLGQKREQLFADYPLDTAELLGLTESGSFDKARWPNVVRSVYGLELMAPSTIRNAYRRNYDRLVAILDQALAGAAVVLTHSPWGDYGHEDHVQVYTAVAEVQRKHGFQIWYPGYVSDRSWLLMQETVVGFSHVYSTMNTNRNLAHELAALYRNHDCWTWYNDYIWPLQETFFLDSGHIKVLASPAVGGNFPVNVLRLGLRQRRVPLHMLSRILKRFRNR